MVTLYKCPVCSSEFIKPMGTAVASSLARAKLWGIDDLTIAVLSFYSKCETCGIVFQNPRPEEDVMDEFYTSGNYILSVGVPVEDVDRTERVRAKRIADMLGKGYTSHLDVGCASGYLLDEVGAERKMGVDVRIDAQAFDIQVTYDIHGEEEFDLVTIIHTLEHEYDPVGMLRKAWAALKPDGTMYVEVPGNLKDGLRLPHLYYFTAETLNNTAAKAGVKWPGEIKHTEPNLGILFKKE